MKKYLKFMLVLPLVVFLTSCGKKAPDVGSDDVEEIAGKLAMDVMGANAWGYVASDYDYKIRNIIKNNVDDEAQKTDFSFQLSIKKKGDKEWTDGPAKFNATAYYTEEGELYVELKR